MHVGTDFLKVPPVTGQYWSLFQCSVLGTGGTCVAMLRHENAALQAQLKSLETAKREAEASLNSLLVQS